MTDMRNEMDSDLDQNYSLNSNADPKNMQELTIYVSFLFACYQTQYESLKYNNIIQKPQRPLSRTPSFPYQVQNLLQNVQDKFQTMSDQIITRIDDMGNRIDDLEKSIADLMNQAGVEGPGPEK